MIYLLSGVAAAPATVSSLRSRGRLPDPSPMLPRFLPDCPGLSSVPPLSGNHRFSGRICGKRERPNQDELNLHHTVQGVNNFFAPFGTFFVDRF